MKPDPLLARIHKALFEPIDSRPLAVFRILFGFLLFFQSAKFILTGWVEKGWAAPQYTFTFIGFEWLSALSGPWMHIHFYLMAACGLLVMLGLFYRLAITSYTLLWIVVYLMEKAYYNNHYYLLILICLLMAVGPANRSFALDNLIRKGTYSPTIPGWSRWIFVLQLLVVYSFAGYAKVDADWLAGAPIAEWFGDDSDQMFMGRFMQSEWYRTGVAVGGLLFDSLIVPAMLWKRTRNIGLALSMIFHLHNSYAFQIGIFPYLMIAMNVFFYPPSEIGGLLSRFIRQSTGQPRVGHMGWSKGQKWILGVGMVYFLVQLWLPLRYLAYPGNVHWTEEGHRMAWQMMLKSKRGEITYVVKIPGTGKTEVVNLYQYLNKAQVVRMETRPDMIWQFAQHLKQDYQSRGFGRVEIYVRSIVSLNGRKPQQFINPRVDLAAKEWYRFKHSDWIMPFVK